MHRKAPFWLAVALFLTFVSVAPAAVTLPPFFADHMVLQRGMEAPIWGKAAPGEKLTIAYRDKSATATADAKGDWTAKLPPLALGEPSTLTITSDAGETKELKDVLVGDVWICSGQSNMQWSVEQSANAAEEIKSATDTNIRMFRVPWVTSVEPTKDLKGGEWKVTSPESAGKFTAVGYFFAREIRAREKVPVGLIDNSWGGMPAESFVTLETLKSDAMFKPIVDRRESLKTLNDPNHPPNAAHAGANIYNAMVHPLIPYAIKGVIWYQGESNADRAEQYRSLFPALIKDWRKAWGQGEFPFYFVQLTGFGMFKPRPEYPYDSNWAELREAQAMTLKAVENTGMAVIVDIGETKDIHPKNKQDVGKRLALAAGKLTYGHEEIEHLGPTFESYKIDGEKVRVKFSHADGLTAHYEPPKSFILAGEDQKFYPADAKIEGEEVIIWSRDVPKPVAARYAWEDDPQVNVINGAGLPMCPFRTDDWKLITAGKK